MTPYYLGSSTKITWNDLKLIYLNEDIKKLANVTLEKLTSTKPSGGESVLSENTFDKSSGYPKATAGVN